MGNNLLDILNKSKQYLKNKGIDNPRLETEKIFANILGIDRITLYTEFERVLTEDEKDKIKNALKNYDSNSNSEVIKNTVKDYYEKTKIYLDKKGFKESTLLTNIIFSKVLNVDIAMLFTKYLQVLDEDLKNKIKDILVKLVDKKLPIQYIFNEQIFYGYSFYVDKNVLIPRIDTEFVVEKALELIISKEKPLVLDIGTGSGNIAITMALENPNSRILSVDISDNALKVAKQNAKNLEVSNVKFLKSDLFENVEFKDFDMIISNPPYISQDETIYMGEDVILHEPENALFAENDGLYFYYEISKLAKDYLKDDGYIIFEIGFKQAIKVKNILESFNYIDINIGKDLNGNDRYVYAKKKG